MTDYEYLIHLISCAVHGTQPAEKPEGVSFKAVLEMGRMHEVANIAFISVEKLQEKPAAELYAEWQLLYFFSVQRDARQMALYEQVTALLHQNGIRTLEAQGTVTKTLYPSPEWRMMSDIDFIIDASNLEKAQALLRDAGYAVPCASDEEFDAVWQDLEIEFHTDFFTREIYDRETNFDKAIHSAFAHAAPDADNPMKYRLDDTYYYLFTVLHTVKHYLTAGCGIRRILDLYYLKKAYDGKADTGFVSQTLEAYGFKDSYDELTALARQWFDDTPATVDISHVIASVLSSGTHGNRDVFAANAVKTDKQEGVKLPALKRILYFVFPPKNLVYANYPVCSERGYGTLRCWLYRITHKMKSARLKDALQHVSAILKSGRHS